MPSAYPLCERDDVLIYRQPPHAYLDWVESSKAYFDGPAWGAILEKGFFTHRSYIWDQRHEIGHALTIFRKGPLRLGYLGFPVCCASSRSAAQYSLARMFAVVEVMPHKPQLCRIAISPFGNRQQAVACGKVNYTIESCIQDLPQWSADANAARRRAVRRAEQRCKTFKFDTYATGEEIFALYVEALRRNEGHARYTRKYFEALSRALSSSHMYLAAFRDDRGLACMVVTVRHGDTTYYLHGGSRPDALHAGASDLAMCRAIEHARSTGAAQFNFLSSPADQPGLTRFKEKWGGESKQAETYTLPVNITGRMLVKWL